MNATDDESSRQRMVVEVLTAFKRAGANVVKCPTMLVKQRESVELTEVRT